MIKPLRIGITLTGVLAGLLVSAGSSGAAASCTPTQFSIAATSSTVTSGWGGVCNQKWNLTVVLQYQDANGWHTADCQNGVACRRDKPNDGSWFAAFAERQGQDDWNPTRPATICDHPFRLRLNFHFASGAGGVTFNGGGDQHPCTTSP